MRNPAMLRARSWLIGLAVVALASSGCSRVRQSQGYLIDETLLTSIQPGVDNRDRPFRHNSMPANGIMYRAIPANMPLPTPRCWSNPS
jgi:hypothetical protein